MTKSLSMDDLLAKYSANPKPPEKGQKVTAKVIKITPKSVIFDIGSKTEGLLAEKALREAKSYIEGLNVGDTLDATVIVPESRDGFTILSLRSAIRAANWDALESAKSENKPVVVMGKNLTGAGLIAEVEGVSAFIPNSQFGKEVSQNPGDLIGEYFKAKIIELNKQENKVVLSEKLVSDAADIQLTRKAVKLIKIGDIFDGVVVNVVDFGLFVKIDLKVEKDTAELEGLVHISELAWEKVGKVRDHFKEGDKVKVKVISVEEKEIGLPKVAFSIKQAQDDPWMTAEEDYPVDSKHKGRITRKNDYGLSVIIGDGVDGFVHMTKIPPGKSYDIGDEIDVYVEEIDIEKRKLSLGLILSTLPLGYK